MLYLWVYYLSSTNQAATDYAAQRRLLQLSFFVGTNQFNQNCLRTRSKEQRFDPLSFSRDTRVFSFCVSFEDTVVSTVKYPK